jgi:hypothetical protein
MGHYKIRSCVRRKSNSAEVITRDEFPDTGSVLGAVEELLNFIHEKDPQLEIVRMTVKEKK